MVHVISSIEIPRNKTILDEWPYILYAPVILLT